MTENEGTLETDILPESVELLSPQNEIIFEIGKEMLKSSINTAREFCKFMITVCLGAIPIYLGLLNFVLSENVILSTNNLIMFVIPLFFYFLSAIIFILGYFPQVDYFSVDIIDEIKNVYDKTVAKRKKIIKMGIVAFFAGNFFAVFFIMNLI